MPIVCFTSDFGLDDTWVGVCHAAVLMICPDAHVVDLSHGIAPYDIRAGAISAATGMFQLPDAIHLVVVDPGVGGDRRAVCLSTESRGFLIGPDNGVLLPAAHRVGGVTHAFELASSNASPTFQARDVFAPAAGRLACGIAPSALGTEIEVSSLVAGPFELCERRSGYVLGEVLGADRYGSLRLNVPSDRLDEFELAGERLEVGIGHNTLTVPLLRTFSDVSEGEPVVVVDSSGWLTLAISRGSAADRYGVTPGSHVRLRVLP